MSNLAAPPRSLGVWATRLLAAVGLLVLVVTFSPFVRWWGRALAGKWTDPRGDVLIVLGGARPTNDGVISYDSYLRSLYAVREYRRQHFNLVLVCGGGSPLTAADSMRAFMLAEGVPGDHVRVENRSKSTYENAVFAKQMLEGVPGTKVLLTSDFHMYRALGVFRKAGLDVVPRPIPDITGGRGLRWSRWPSFVQLVEEEIKTVYYVGRGWL